MAPRGRLFAIHRRGVRWLAKEIVPLGGHEFTVGDDAATRAGDLLNVRDAPLTPSTPFLLYFLDVVGLQGQRPPRALLKAVVVE